MLMLCAAIPLLIMHRPFGIVLTAAGVATLLATLLKCIVYAVHSEVSGLPSIGEMSPLASRVLYRASIAWLHFVQPFARLCGRARGALNAPLSSASPSHVHAAAPASVVSAIALSDVVRAVRLCVFRSIETVYWSERWVDVGDLVRATGDRLRRQRAVRQIELDSGWWDDRDLTIADRTSVRLDVRVLLEDHGRGRCLYRWEIKPRLSAGVGLPLLLAVVLALSLRYVGAPWAVGCVSATVLAATFMIGGVIGTSRVLVAALDAVMMEFGMIPVLPRQRQPEPEAPPDPTPALPELIVTARAATQEPSPSQAFATDM